MASSYLNNYCGEESSSDSCNVVARMRWKPRTVSAKRDFPKAEIPPTTVNEPQNVSDSGCSVSQSPKRHKVYVEHEFKQWVSDDEDDMGPAESEEGSAVTGPFDLASESTDDVVSFETYDCVSSGSYTSSEIDNSDYDMSPETVIEDEDTDLVELINTEKPRSYVTRSVSAVRCFPPGCGRNAVQLSDEELEKELKESKNHWLTCESGRIDDDDEEESCADNEDLISGANLQDCGIDSKPSGKQTRSRRPRVWTVRYFPLGCGPDVAPLTEEELQLAINVSRKHMLSCTSSGIQETNSD